MTKILLDTTLDRQLTEEGYAIFPLLPPPVVEELKSYFYEHFSQPVDNMFATAHDQRKELRNAISNHLLTTVQKYINQYTHEISILGGSYITKGNHKQATLPPHQDWNIVDESQYRSFNLWIPLVNTNHQNGGIQVLRRSHLFSPTFRGPNISSAYEHVADLIWKQMETLDIAAGHALLYDHRLLHASGINQLNEGRLVVVMGAIEKQAQMKIYYRAETFIEEYDCDQSFFTLNNPAEGPKGLNLSKKIPFQLPVFNENNVKGFFNSFQLTYYKETTTWWNKLKKLFSEKL